VTGTYRSEKPEKVRGCRSDPPRSQSTGKDRSGGEAAEYFVDESRQRMSRNRSVPHARDAPLHIVGAGQLLVFRLLRHRGRFSRKAADADSIGPQRKAKTITGCDDVAQALAQTVAFGKAARIKR